MMTDSDRQDKSFLLTTGIFMAVLVLRPHLHSGAFPHFDGLLLLLLFISLAVTFLQHKTVTGLLTWARGPMITLAAAASWLSLSLAWSVDKGSGTRAVLALLAGGASFLLAFILTGDRERSTAGIFLLLPVVMLPVSLHAFYQKIWGLERMKELLVGMEAAGAQTADIVAYINSGRVAAGFGNPNMLAGLMAISLPLAVGVALSASRRWQVAAWGQVAMIAGTLLLTGSMSGMLAAGAGLIIFAAAPAVKTASTRKLLWPALATVAAAGAVVLMRGTGFLVGPESSIVQRTGYFKAGTVMALEKPFLGWGAGSATETLMRFVSSGYRPVTDPHNVFITLWIWGGLAGTVLMVIFLFSWLKKVLPAAMEVDNWPARSLFAGASAFWIHSLVDMNFSVANLSLFGWTVMGAALGCAASSPDPENPTGPSPYKTGLAIVLLAACLPVFAITYGEIVARAGEKSLEAGDYRSALEASAQAEKILPWYGGPPLASARAYRLMGEPGEAGASLERARALLSESPYPYWEAGINALERSRPGSALEELRAALDRYPASPWIPLDLAKARLMMGQKDEAIKALELALGNARYEVRAAREAREAIDMLKGSSGPQ
jgi:O-antigen ligase